MQGIAKSSEIRLLAISCVSTVHDNITLLYDAELSDKVNRLVSVGKAPLDIYLNPNILLKYEY